MRARHRLWWWGAAVLTGGLGGCGRIGFDPADVPVPDCGEAATGHCYQLFEAMVTWDVASAACAGLGEHLITIGDSAANADAFGYARTIPFDPTMTTNHRSIMWLGADDRPGGTDWVWVTAEPFDYTDWRAGEPNASGEECLAMLGAEAGQWDNRPCDYTFGYLCERE